MLVVACRPSRAGFRIIEQKVKSIERYIKQVRIRRVTVVPTCEWCGNPKTVGESLGLESRLRQGTLDFPGNLFRAPILVIGQPPDPTS